MSRFEKVVTLGALVLLLGLGGFLSGYFYRHNNVWPTSQLVILERQWNFYRNHGAWARLGLYIPADVTAQAPRARVLRPEDFIPGYRMIMGYDSDLEIYSLRLLDSRANQIHVWRLDYREIRPDHDPGGAINPHGLEVFPDGSVVVNFAAGTEAFTRLNSCGTPMWMLTDGRYHHSVHLDEDGLLWTWFSPNEIERQLENIVAVDAENGEVRRKIAMREIAAVSRRNAVPLAIPEGHVISRRRELPPDMLPDIHHPNDVEPLSTGMAAAFPMFEPGDLLISLRNINYVGVLDPDTLELKWGRNGPWERQHDPDFTEDGQIIVYNNNSLRGRSDILSIDPATDEVTRVFTSEGSDFYSGTQGKHQKLPNGNYLITVPAEGRVIELNSNGDLVFEYTNTVQDGLTARTLNAFWVPEEFFTETPTCPG